MLRNIPLILLVSASLVACGGSDNKKKNNSSSSVPSSVASSAPASVASSAPASVASSAPASVASSAPASVASSAPASVASSAPASSAPAAPTVINADMTTGWRGNNGGTVSFSTDGVTLVGTADGQGAVFDILAPIQLEGAVVEMVVNVSNEYKTSGADLQIFAQVKTGNYPGEYDCYTGNVDLTPGTDQTLTCTIDQGTLFTQTEHDVQVGIQVKSLNAIAGTVIIKSAKVTLATQAASSSAASSTPVASSSSSSAMSNTLTIPVDTVTGWSNDGKPTTFSVNNGIVLTPDWTDTQNIGMFILDAPINLTNATVTYVISVPQSYITDGAMVIQPFSQQNSLPFAGIFDGSITGGWNPSSGLTAGDNTIVHGPFTSAPADIQRIGVALNKQTMGAGVTGDIIIRSITVNFPN